LNNLTLTYTIRFQNVGNAEAINIHVLDSISALLDINTFRVIAASHDMYTEIIDTTVIKFNFENIELPPIAEGYPQSQGYVIFKIDPIDSTLTETVVNNYAGIYFDFNPPVITNTVFNTLMNTIPLCDDVSINVDETDMSNIIIYPNPNSGNFSIDLSSLERVSIKLLNLNGQTIYKRDKINGGIHNIEIDGPSGIYILELLSNDYTEHIKIIKR